MRPFLVPPKLKTVQDRLRYYARAKGITLTQLTVAMTGTKYPQNGRRIFYAKRFNPKFIDRACLYLGLPEAERRLLHRLGANQDGWDVIQSGDPN